MFWTWFHSAVLLLPQVPKKDMLPAAGLPDTAAQHLSAGQQHQQQLEQQPAGSSSCAAELPGQSCPGGLQSGFVTEPALPPQLLAGPPCIKPQQAGTVLHCNDKTRTQFCLNETSREHLHPKAA